jgi:hypothetical protein
MTHSTTEHATSTENGVEYQRPDSLAELRAVVRALEAVVAQRASDPPLQERSGPSARRLLGNLLVVRGYIVASELRIALDRQASAPGRRLGDILIEMGLISDRDLAEVLAEQMRLPLVRLQNLPIDGELVRMLSRHDARTLGAIPIRRNPDGGLDVAMADPTDDRAVETLQLLLREPMRLFVAARSDIETAVDRRAPISAYGDRADG